MKTWDIIYLSLFMMEVGLLIFAFINAWLLAFVVAFVGSLFVMKCWKDVRSMHHG